MVAMRAPGRQSPQDVTLFKSLGIGIEDVAVGIKLYHKAKEPRYRTLYKLVNQDRCNLNLVYK